MLVNRQRWMLGRIRKIHATAAVVRAVVLLRFRAGLDVIRHRTLNVTAKIGRSLDLMVALDTTRP